jgi:hypothetical protein
VVQRCDHCGAEITARLQGEARNCCPVCLRPLSHAVIQPEHMAEIVPPREVVRIAWSHTLLQILWSWLVLATSLASLLTTLVLLINITFAPPRGRADAVALLDWLFLLRFFVGICERCRTSDEPFASLQTQSDY